MNNNIIRDKSLQNRIDNKTLTIADHVRISLAEFLSSLFPGVKVYLNQNQQKLALPSLFVGFYEIANQQRMIDTSEYEFGFELSYIPDDKHSNTELTHAIFLIMQNLHFIDSEIGQFAVYSKNSDITDRIAHVTGLIRVMEITTPNDPMINQAEKELIV